MEDSWRFRSIQGNICPTCSTSHFPFCPQPLPFDRNGFIGGGGGGGGGLHRIPNDPSFHRPLFDPYSDNRMMPRPSLHYDDRVNSMPPMYGNPKDGYGKPRSWNMNSNLVRDPLNQFRQPPPMPDSAMFNRDGYDYGSTTRFTRGEFSESDRIHKRMKVDEMGSGSFTQIPTPVGNDYPSNPKQMSVEDERRLNLIREHGGPTSGMQSHGGLDSLSRPGNVHGGNQVNAYLQDGSLRPPSNKGTISLQDYGSENSSGFGHQQMSSVDHSLFRNNSQQLQYSDYGNNPLHPSLHSHGPSKIQTGAPNFVNPTQQSQDSTSQHADLYHQPIVPHHSPYPTSHEEYHAHDFQQLQSKDFDRLKDSQYPHVSNKQVSSGYQGQQSDLKHSFEVRAPPLPGVQQFGSPNLSRQGSYLPISPGNGMTSTRQGQIQSPQPFGVHPPLPPMPPPPFPMEPAGPPPSHMQARSSAQIPSSSFYPIPAGSSVSLPMLHQSTHETQSFPPKHTSPDKPKVIDASHLLRRPHRASRPDHIVIILRGLPGSGKSYLAKMLRDLEVENGGDAPRIHSMDDYFMTEVEKVEEREGSKTSNSAKGRKQNIKKVMEYCYEPQMEEAYRSSMLKAFKKNLEEGSFTFIIVDDRNLRVADFAQFWAIAKRSGYEVYLLEAAYKDPVGCAARNVHGFTLDDIKKMAELWEEAPSLYLQLDVQSLFHADGLDETGIQEVDMDTEDDVVCGEGSSELHNANSLKPREQPVEDYAPDGSFKDEERWDAEEDDSTGVKELGRSKWSQDVDEEDTERCQGAKRNSGALSGLIQAYAKGDKSVHWGDQVGKTGFSIGAAKKANLLSLVIGPGAGYNLKSNPLVEKESVSKAAESSWESNKRSVFQEHLRAERESFRAVFDRRRHRIGGLEAEDE